jgi:biopolymer transport protein ExbD
MGLKRRSKASAEFSMSSMTDIIFLLLIFFMLTSTLVSQNALNLKLPSSSSTTVAPPSMAVSITKDGRFYYNATQMPLESIERNIVRELKDSREKDRTTLTIVAERGVAIEYVVQIMDLANRMGINAILATEPKK